MPEIPFPVVSNLFAAPAQPVPDAFKALSRPLAPPKETATTSTGSRRRRLWEIPHKCHCPVIGVCFGVDELRSLMAKVMHFPANTTDFVLHTTAVGACETRTRLAELLHKQLEKRYALVIRQISACKDSEGLRDLWRRAVRSGNDIPATLWACWTHPGCDPVLDQEIYGDIHMLQHQIGTGTRADLATLKALQADNAQLRRQLEEARRELEGQRNEKIRETRTLGERVAELRVELAGKDASLANLTGQLALLRESLPELKERQALARRASDAEARAAALTARCADLEAEAERLTQLAHRAEAHLRHWADPPSAATEAAPLPSEDSDHLSGKCVLCVGGRSGAVDAYRQIVEQRGGRFLHHDGGLEESLHRIDAALSAADLVVCQAGCISHNAYWRVKEQCKRTGKQCIFIKGSGGVSTFGRIVSAACTPDLAITVE